MDYCKSSGIENQALYLYANDCGTDTESYKCLTHSSVENSATT